MKKIYYVGFFYIVLGLAFGVFYREFTVYHDYQGYTQLSLLHTHTLLLGGIFMIILLILEKAFTISHVKRFNLWFMIYQIGLVGLLATMLVRGIGQVLDWQLNGFNHVAGLFHTILGLALVWFMLILGKALKTQKL